MVLNYNEIYIFEVLGKTSNSHTKVTGHCSDVNLVRLFVMKLTKGLFKRQAAFHH